MPWTSECIDCGETEPCVLMTECRCESCNQEILESSADNLKKE